MHAQWRSCVMCVRWPLVSLLSAWGGHACGYGFGPSPRPTGKDAVIGAADRQSGDPANPSPPAPLLGRRPRPAARREGHDRGQPDHDPHLQGRIRARAVDAEGRRASSCSPPIRSATGRAGSAPSCARATGRRRKASTRWAPTSSTGRAAGRARSTSAFPTRSIGPMRRTGSYILVHGGCLDRLLRHDQPGDGRDLRLSEQALRQGQDRIPVHAFPVPHDRGQPGGARRAAHGTHSG